MVALQEGELALADESLRDERKGDGDGHPRGEGCERGHDAA